MDELPLVRQGSGNSWHGGEAVKMNQSLGGVLISLPSPGLIYPAEHQPTLVSSMAFPPSVTAALLLEHSPSADFGAAARSVYHTEEH